MEEHDKIELRSEEVQEILGTPPSAIIRWGTMVVLLTLVALGIVSYLVKYPDKIRAPIMLTTANPPIEIVAPQAGYIDELLVGDKEEVFEGDLLVVMQNPADYLDVLELDGVLDEIATYNLEQLKIYSPPTELELGDLQFPYSNFVQKLELLVYSATSGYNIKNKVNLREQIENLKKDIVLSEKRIKRIDNDIVLVKRKHKRYYDGYPEIFSREQLEAVGRERKKLEDDADLIRASINARKKEITSIENQMVNIDKTTDNNFNDNFSSFKASLNDLRSNIKQWKETFLSTSPIDGTVSFHNDVRNEKQFVTGNVSIMSIVPPGGDYIQGRVQVPTKKSGKVAVGQKVVIKLDGYPYEEFGSLKGEIKSISLTPKNNTYSVIVVLPNGMTTSHNERIIFTQKMTGLAEIITEKKRFIEKVFEELLSRLENFS